MGIWQFIKDLASGTAAFFRFTEKKQDLDNTAAMQARAQGAADQQIKDDAAKAIAKGDLGKIQKDLAE